MDIGLRLKKLRENADMTQQEVGNLIGVTKATVNRYETGEIDIKRAIAVKLANVFNVSPAYIMGWEDTDEKHNDNEVHKENSLAYFRDGKTTEVSLPKDKMDIIIKMIDALKEDDIDL